MYDDDDWLPLEPPANRSSRPRSTSDSNELPGSFLISVPGFDAAGVVLGGGGGGGAGGHIPGNRFWGNSMASELRMDVEVVSNSGVVVITDDGEVVLITDVVVVVLFCVVEGEAVVISVMLVVLIDCIEVTVVAKPGGDELNKLFNWIFGVVTVLVFP